MYVRVHAPGTGRLACSFASKLAPKSDRGKRRKRQTKDTSSNEKRRKD